MAENGKEDVESDVIETIEAKDDPKVVAAQLTSKLIADPNVLAAFESKLGSMIGQKSGYIESLPKTVKRRLRALKKLQADIFTVESKFYDEVHALECKFESLYQPLFEKRQNIVNAVHEPTDSECEWQSDEEEDEDEEKKKETTIAIEGGETKEGEEKTDHFDENTKGVPEFWLTIFKNVELLSSMLQEHDEPVLKSLLDIKVKYAAPENMGFTLEFVFAPNDYFNNTMLTKEYIMRSKPHPDRPLNYDGPEITKCIGCSIDWKKGKNITLKTVKQKQKGKGGAKKTVTKTVKTDSFFNFFSPPEAKEDEEEEDEELESILVTDYEIGQMIQSSIIPKAVLYFTGEALDECDDDDYEDGEGEEGDEGEYDEDDDPDFKPPKGDKGAAPECKQQ